MDDAVSRPRRERDSARPVVEGRRGWWPELLLIAGISLGQSAVYAVVRLTDLMTRAPLAEGQARLNTSASDRPIFDLVYQLLGIGFALVPVLLAVYLLSRDRLLVRESAGVGAAGPGASSSASGSSGTAVGGDVGAPTFSRLGITGVRHGRDLLRGVAIFLVIGLGTLGLYAAGRWLGITAQISPSNLGAHWWTVPVLLLAAVKNSVLEEVLIMGYARIRLAQMGVNPWAAIAGLAVFRASYHLYQGIGPFIGNVAMGLLFGSLALHWERRNRERGAGAAVGAVVLMPFLWAHFLIDAVGFLAPGVLAAVDPR